MTDNLTGQILDKKYLIKELLGEGGMGAVYHGEHISMGKRVAVKFLHSSFISNEEVVKRFFREARAASSIAHRNIIDVMDMGVSPGGEPYLVMEYLAGIDLDTVLEKKGRINLPTAVAIMDFALQAIGAAHQKGIVHRDLKPENIYISLQNGDEPEIKLIDFGISKFEDKNTTKLTVEGTTLGTPAYMSPEQARGSKDLNFSTDIYSTGVILYQLLSGTTPFEGENYNELLVNILTSEPQSPEAICNDFPMEIWPVIQKAISKQPEERYESAEELRKVLKSFSDDQKNRDALYELGQFIKNEVSTPKEFKNSVVKNAGKSAEAILSELVSDTIAVNSAEGLLRTDINSPNNSSAPPVETEKKKKTELVVKIPIPNKETVLKTRDAVEKNSRIVFRFIKYLVSIVVKVVLKIKYFLFDSPRKKVFRIIFAILAAIPLFFFLLTLTGFNKVDITIKNLPNKSLVIYDGEIVEDNPFSVTKSDKPTLLRINRFGRTKMRLNIIPDDNKVVVYSTFGKPKVKVQKDVPEKTVSKASMENEPDDNSTKNSNTAADEPKSDKPRSSTKSSSSSKKSSGSSSKNPFKKLGSNLKRAFNN